MFIKRFILTCLRLLGAKYAETFGCMYADFGSMSIKRLGACMRLLAASFITAERLPDSR